MKKHENIKAASYFKAIVVSQQHQELHGIYLNSSANAPPKNTTITNKLHYTSKSTKIDSEQQVFSTIT